MRTGGAIKGWGITAALMLSVAPGALAHAASETELTPQSLTPGPAPAVPPLNRPQSPVAPTAASGDNTVQADQRAGFPGGTVPPTNDLPVATARQVERGASALNPTGRDIVITVPLRERGPLGQVQMKLSAAGEISVSSDDLLAALSRIARPEALARLKAASVGGAVSLPAARQAGFPLTYDAGASELTVDIPVTARRSQTLDLGLPIDHQTVQPDKSSPAAIFLNYRAGEAYEIDGPLRGKVGTVADLQLSGRILGVAFENFGTIDQLANHTAVRTASRLIYDIPGPALRITAGDLFTETTAFQSDPQIAGVNFSHLISTFYPSSAISGRSSRSLTVAAPSTVEILVNGAPLTQVRLGPGTYDLRDFPLASGSNNVQAVVTDDAGERRVLSFSFFSDANLLTPGFDEYTASVGVLAPLGDNGPRYQTNQPVVSGFYRRGLTEQFTAGANLQASRFNQVFGADLVFGAPFGLFAFDASINHLESGDVGEALRLTYRYASHTERLQSARTFDASVELRSRRFADINTQNPDNTEEALFAVNFNQPLRGRLLLTLSGSYFKSRIDGQDTADASAFLNWQAPLDTTVGVGVAYRYAPKPVFGSDIVGNRGFSIAGTLTKRFGATSLLSASADRFQQRVDYVRSPIHPTGDYAVNADFAHTDFGYTGTGAVAYETNRGNLQGQYTNAFQPDGTITNQIVSATFDGSIVFAGGKVALGRRITDAFAIIDGHPSLEGKQVLVQSRFADDVLAQSGTFGPAVVPIVSYQRQVIPYDVKDLPIGYDLGTSNFEVYPWLHSGFALTVGSAYYLTIVGDLVDAEGQPVALRVGTATSLTDPKAPKLDVITNASGRFALLGASAGRWRVTLPGTPTLSYDIVVAAPARGAKDGSLVRVGSVKPGQASVAIPARQEK